MKKVNQNSIVLFLLTYDQELLGKEKVLHYNGMLTQPFSTDSFLKVLSFIVAIALVLVAFYVNEFGFYFTLLILLFLIPVMQSKKRTTVTVEKPFCLITSKGIRVEKLFITWDDVKSINYSAYENRLIFNFLKMNQDYSLTSEEVVKSAINRSFMVLGGKYNSMALYNAILPHWKWNSPDEQIKGINTSVANKNKLVVRIDKESTVFLEGTTRDITLSCTYDVAWPIQQIKIFASFENQIPCYFSIVKETLKSTLKNSLGIEDLKIGNPQLDKGFQFLSSHPKLIEQVFTEEVITTFKRLESLGTVSWVLGRPIKEKRLSSYSASRQEPEDILDASAFNEIEAEEVIENEEDFGTLEFNGILNPEYQESQKKVKEFMNLGMELSVVFAETISKIKV